MWSATLPIGAGVVGVLRSARVNGFGSSDVLDMVGLCDWLGLESKFKSKAASLPDGPAVRG